MRTALPVTRIIIFTRPVRSLRTSSSRRSFPLCSLYLVLKNTFQAFFIKKMQELLTLEQVGKQPFDFSRY